MQPPFAPRRPAPAGDYAESSREGRDCEAAHRATLLVLFPGLNARPGGWLLFLAAVCTFVAVRALELAHF